MRITVEVPKDHANGFLTWATEAGYEPVEAPAGFTAPTFASSPATDAPVHVDVKDPFTGKRGSYSVKRGVYYAHDPILAGVTWFATRHASDGADTIDKAPMPAWAWRHRIGKVYYPVTQRAALARAMGAVIPADAPAPARKARKARKV